MTVAMLFFYLAALLLYYSIGIWIPQQEPCFVNTYSIQITEFENPEEYSQEKHFTLCYFCPDLTAKTPEADRVSPPQRQSEVSSDYRFRARDGTPDHKHSRDPPQQPQYI